MSIFARLRQRVERTRDAASTHRVTVDLFDEGFLRQLASLSLMSRRAVAGVRRGERRSKKRGSGVEFADHRSYVPGDDIRFLDVGVYQRFGKLLLRLFEEEEDLSVYLLIDVSGSMGTANARKLNQAAQVAAALAFVALSGLDRVSVSLLGDSVVGRLAPTRSKQRVFRVLRFLSRMKAEGATDLSTACRQFAAQNPRRGLAVLMSDLYDQRGFEAGINALRFNKFDCVVLQLHDRKDDDLADAGDVLLTDVETGATREVSMTPALLRRLRERQEERNAEIARFCKKKGVPHFLVDVELPFDQVVLNLLRRGGVLS